LGLNIVDSHSVFETTGKSFDVYASGPSRAFGREHEAVVGVIQFDRDIDTIRLG